MQKTLTYLLLAGSGLMILDSFDFMHSLTIFLLAGVIPGTNIIISPVDMMAASATAFTVLILRIVLWPTLKNIMFNINSEKALKQN